MSASVYQLEARFSGRVQGVGFRARTLAVARGFDVTGCVRNLDDGRVYLFAEGRETEVTGFLESVEASMPAYIKGVETGHACGARKYTDFTIDR